MWKPKGFGIFGDVREIAIGGCSWALKGRVCGGGVGEGADEEEEEEGWRSDGAGGSYGTAGWEYGSVKKYVLA